MMGCTLILRYCNNILNFCPSLGFYNRKKSIWNNEALLYLASRTRFWHRTVSLQQNMPRRKEAPVHPEIDFHRMLRKTWSQPLAAMLSMVRVRACRSSYCQSFCQSLARKILRKTGVHIKVRFWNFWWKKWEFWSQWKINEIAEQTSALWEIVCSRLKVNICCLPGNGVRSFQAQTFICLEATSLWNSSINALNTWNYICSHSLSTLPKRKCRS